jgi:hypothetical protein
MPRPSSSILDLARRGAEVRWNELQSELAGLLKAFPDLRSRTIPTTRQGNRGQAASDNGTPRKARRRSMSPAARRAVSVRMKKDWAARRKEKA